MAISHRTARTSWWRELGLVVIGAAIALSSSILTTNMQSNNQREQWIYDRKVQLIRDTAKNINEYATRLIQITDNSIMLIENIIDSLSNGLPPSYHDREELRRNLNEMSQLSVSASGLAAEKILIHALFGEKAPDLKLEYNDAELDVAFERIAQKMREANTPKKQDEVMIESYKNLKSVLTKLNHEIIKGQNNANEKFLELAKQIRP